MLKPVRVNEHGLAIPPSKRDCLGEHCTEINDGRDCFVDRHHLYFPARMRKVSELLIEFALRPENIIPIARCAHNKHHERRDRARFPNDDVMEAFIDESKFLEAFGVTVEVMDLKLDALNEEDLKHKNKLQLKQDVRDLHERHKQMKMASDHLELIEPDFSTGALAKTFEVEDRVQEFYRKAS